MSETSPTSSAANERLPAAMQNDIVKKLVWSGILAGVGAVAAIAARKVAEQIWIRVFNEPPPID
jgi:hypothetical protein